MIDQRRSCTILLSGLIFFSLLGCKHSDPAIQTEKLPAVQVQVAPVKLESIRNQIELQGSVQATNRSEIASKISGTILKITVNLGSQVKKGELLAELAAGEIDAKLQQTRTQFEQARRNAEREKRLLQKNAATSESVKSLEELVKISESAYQEAQAYKEYTRITAPFSGRITKKLANAGDLATPGKPLLILEDEQQFQVVLNIPEAIAAQTSQGTAVRVSIPAIDLAEAGTVSEISHNAEGSSRTVLTKINISKHPLLQSGQFARVSLAQQDSQTLVIPAEAVSIYGQLARVFVVDNNYARLRIVKTGASYDASQEVLSGLSAGENVVTKSQSALKDGQPVTLQ